MTNSTTEAMTMLDKISAIADRLEASVADLDARITRLEERADRPTL